MKTLFALMLLTTAAFAAPAPSSPDRWAPLTSAEQRALADVLKSAEPGSVTVACPLRTCAALATSIEEAFAKAQWNVTKVRKGGLGITGIQAIRVSGCNDKRLVPIAKAVGAAELVVEPACSGADEVVIVIGDKP